MNYITCSFHNNGECLNSEFKGSTLIINHILHDYRGDSFHKTMVKLDHIKYGFYCSPDVAIAHERELMKNNNAPQTLRSSQSTPL